jgi:ATP adenylyltransferase
MKHLWASWRLKYIQKKDPETGCVFCNAIAKPDDGKNLIITRGTHCVAILNKYPYTSGHLMIVPNQHAADLNELTPETRAEMMENVAKFTGVIQRAYNPQGFNIGINLGSAGGAGIPGHIHIHIVPRWGGDTNFMSTIGETRVLPESLEDTYQRVMSAYKNE